MGREREVRTETDILGREREYVYENGSRVGEIKTEERGWIPGFTEEVSVEYDLEGNERSTTREETQSRMLGLFTEDVQVTRDTDNKVTEVSKVEEVGGFMGHFMHHERVGRNLDNDVVSRTYHDQRGGLFGWGSRKVKVSQYKSEHQSAVQNNVSQTSTINTGRQSSRVGVEKGVFSKGLDRHSSLSSRWLLFAFYVWLSVRVFTEYLSEVEPGFIWVVLTILFFPGMVIGFFLGHTLYVLGVDPAIIVFIFGE